MKKIADALPESRKLRVMLGTLLGFILHCQFPFLTPDQVYTCLSIVGGWMGIQGIADAGAQGFARAKIRELAPQRYEPTKNSRRDPGPPPTTPSSAVLSGSTGSKAE